MTKSAGSGQTAGPGLTNISSHSSFDGSALSDLLRTVNSSGVSDRQSVSATAEAKTCLLVRSCSGYSPLVWNASFSSPLMFFSFASCASGFLLMSSPTRTCAPSLKRSKERSRRSRYCSRLILYTRSLSPRGSSSVGPSTDPPKRLPNRTMVASTDPFFPDTYSFERHASTRLSQFFCSFLSLLKMGIHPMDFSLFTLLVRGAHNTAFSGPSTAVSRSLPNPSHFITVSITAFPMMASSAQTTTPVMPSRHPKPGGSDSSGRPKRAREITSSPAASASRSIPFLMNDLNWSTLLLGHTTRESIPRALRCLAMTSWKSDGPTSTTFSGQPLEGEEAMERPFVDGATPWRPPKATVGAVKALAVPQISKKGAQIFMVVFETDTVRGITRLDLVG
mmetsp:Transcript_2116/g.5597  ORF Transcript_2116/g.5597 Transcript_2116/m.5597 type:complete len:392 (-) Transcript_2116:4-1179(-)